MKKFILSNLLILSMVFCLISCDFSTVITEDNSQAITEDNSQAITEDTQPKISSTLTIDCPTNLKYAFGATEHTEEVIYSSCKLENIKYEFKENLLGDVYLHISYDVTKTYDNGGEKNNQFVYFGYILYGSDGSVLKTDRIMIMDMIVNQTLKDKTINIKLENLNNNYKIEFIDHVL